MFCESYGKEIPDDANFCTYCGNHLKRKKKTVNEKNMNVALILSLFLLGLGLCYAGKTKKGIILFVLISIFKYLRHSSPIFFIIAMILWAYAIYETYREVKKANGESNQSLIEDIRNLSDFKHLTPIVVIAILMLVYSFLIEIILY